MESYVLFDVDAARSDLCLSWLSNSHSSAAGSCRRSLLSSSAQHQDNFRKRGNMLVETKLTIMRGATKTIHMIHRTRHEPDIDEMPRMQRDRLK